jgi:hypothetical protein
MTETNSANLEKAKKLGDEHQELYKLLSDENLENILSNNVKKR